MYNPIGHNCNELVFFKDCSSDISLLDHQRLCELVLSPKKHRDDFGAFPERP